MNTLVASKVPEVGYRSVLMQIGDYSWLEEILQERYPTFDLLETFLTYNVQELPESGVPVYTEESYVIYPCIPSLLRAGRAREISRIYLHTGTKWHAFQVKSRNTRWREGWRYVPVGS